MDANDRASVTIRAAAGADTPTILRLIREMAAHEGQSGSCTATEEGLQDGLFGPRPSAEVILAEEAGSSVGFALFYPCFVPFTGVSGIFMELLYVVEGRRGSGVGTALVSRLAQIAVERGAGRLEWCVMQENAPAIGFYLHLGATGMDALLACRLEGAALRRVANGEPVR